MTSHKNRRHCNFTVFVSQVRIQWQPGRPVKETAIHPGHRWAHKNGINRQKIINYFHPACLFILCALTFCVFVNVKLRAANEYEERKMIRAAIRQIREEQQQGESSFVCMCLLDLIYHLWSRWKYIFYKWGSVTPVVGCKKAFKGDSFCVLAAKIVTLISLKGELQKHS